MMKCPKCSAIMNSAAHYREGEDEKSDGRMYPYALWICECGHVTHEYDDDFKYVENGRVVDGESEAPPKDSLFENYSSEYSIDELLGPDVP